MDTHTLSFAKINILQPDIAEVVVNEGIEMNMEMVNEYHRFLLANLKAPFSLLINKINSYSYDFQAQINLAVLKEINVMAVVTYSNVTRHSTQMLSSNVPRKIDWNLQLFDDKNSALTWLEAMQTKMKQGLKELL